MNFSDWSEALPFALSVGRAFARRSPIACDVESVVMEALWRAQQRGAVFSRSYVALRVRGALKDEMRTNAEGQRGNYQNAHAFTDVHEMGDTLGSPGADPVERIDRIRLLEAMPDAARFLVHGLVRGREHKETAAELGVSAARVSQVLCDLRANPHRVRLLPGQVDFFGEMAQAHRRILQQAHQRAGTVTGTAQLLNVSVSDASRWLSTSKLGPLRKLATHPDWESRARTLVRTAFARANGSPQSAGRLLRTDNHTASNLGSRFAPDLVRSNRRPDLTIEQILRLRRKRWSMARIALQFGVSEHTIRNRCRARALPADVPRTLQKTRPDLPDSAFAELRARGLAWREIAETLGVSMATVYHRLRRAKGPVKCETP